MKYKLINENIDNNLTAIEQILINRRNKIFWYSSLLKYNR